MHILNSHQEDLLKHERQLLSDLRVALVQFGAADADERTLAESIQQLDELFLLVVVGEFNAGKSAFINALLGQKLLKEGVTPTTTQINILRFGQEQERIVVNESQHVLTLPVDWLAEISIVDTPGTNAIIRAHEAITSQFVPRSDLVLFITSADRPFTESERLFLERIRDWGKKVVIVINKIDILQSEEDLQQVQTFVAENARQLLGITPEIFPVSARQALRAKQGEPALWNESRFEALETFIRDTLDEKGRLKLKFLNPLGVGMHLTENYLGVIRSRLDLLQVDTDTLADVDAQMGLYSEDMQRDFKFRLSDMENILYEMEQRGQDYFDETFRLARVFDLLSKERIRTEFEQRVIGDVPQRIEHKVTELIDWLVDSDLRQWKAVNDHLAERRKAHQERIVGDTGPGSFRYDRERLIEAVGREAQRVVETYDRDFEAQSIAESAQAAVAASAALEVGAVGLGTLVTILATTAAADVTGILLASVVAALGLIVIPARKRMAKAELRDKIAALREQLIHTLQTQFEKEIERSMSNINEAIAPYTRFVRAEKGKLLETQTGLEHIQGQLNNLKGSIEELD
ncbi:MAG: dynamin family protein [Anaerolineales bacterium]|nr:dynamin family protein [Anaerolineales bacterium]